MKVLLISDPDSAWTRNFVNNFLLKKDCEIWMLMQDSESSYSYYQRKGIQVLNFKGGRSCIVKNLVKLIKCYIKFDVINLHYVVFKRLVIALLLKIVTGGRLVLSYWGSDLLRAEDKQLVKTKELVRCADFVTFDNRDLEIKFKSLYKRNKTPLVSAFFGLPILNIIKEKGEKEFVLSIRRKWGITDGKTIVAVGYNGIKEQQHIRVLQNIGKLSQQVKDRIIILLQMTYGGTDEYKEKVIKEAAKTGCAYMDIQSFLTDEEVAEIRIMTDIYINAQTTDAFSGSVCENLYAGTVLINAGWLCYQEFKDFDFSYLEFKEMDEIGGLIERVIEKGYRPNVSKNKELVWKLRSWEHCSRKWEKVYEKVIK